MSELGPDAREILRNGRTGDDPSPADRARIHAALMATIAASAATTAATSASASTANVGLSASVGAAKPVVASLFGSVFAKGMLIVFLGAAGTGAWLAWPKASQTSSIPRIPDQQTAPISTEIVAPPPAAPAEVAEEKQIDPPAAAPVLVAPVKPLPVHGSASATAAKTPEEPADSIIAETQRLREAHGALRSGDPEKALALLSEEAAETEGQKLREERAAARVLVLCKLGRVDEANAEAAAFLAQNPRSPHADRVRKACPTNR